MRKYKRKAADYALCTTADRARKGVHFYMDDYKFVRYNDSKSATAPMETMTKGRVYVTVNNRDALVSVSYYDKDNKRFKQIDLTHSHDDKIPHTHHGYFHNENDGKSGASNPTPREKEMIARVKRLWYDK